MNNSTNFHKLGLLCWKTKYSEYSKVFYLLAKENNIQAEYKKFETDPSRLDIDLSRMFTNKIRGYTVPPPLQEAILPLLDIIDKSVNDKVNTVINRNGVLYGYYLEHTSTEILIKNEINLWKISVRNVN